MVVAFEDGEGFRSFGLKKPIYVSRDPRQFPVLPLFLYDSKKATTLLDRWVNDRFIILLEVYRVPSSEDQRHPVYCP